MNLRLAWGLVGIVFAASPALSNERSYSVGDFERVRVTGAISVNIVYGRATSARASGSLSALDRLSVSVRDRELVITPQSAAGSGFPEKAGVPPLVTITVPVISRIRVNGSAKVTAARVGGSTTELSLAGSGTLQVADLQTDRGNISLTGEGRIKISGAAKSLTAVAIGSGTIDAGQLKVADLSVESSSSGNATFLAGRSAKLVSTGSGDLVVLGKPACTVRNAGSGAVTCGEKDARR